MKKDNEGKEWLKEMAMYASGRKEIIKIMLEEMAKTYGHTNENRIKSELRREVLET